MSNSYSLYTDGGARGNPGPGGAGVFILQDDEVLLKKGKYLGKVTNNQAEYSALILGLEELIKKDIKEVNCYLDSELIVKQLKGEYKVRDDKLKPLYGEVLVLASKFKEISFTHVPRAKNKEADTLVNMAIDKALKK